jgi:hypothetical protein
MTDSKNDKGQFESIDPWTPAQEAWLLKGIARGTSQAKLYRQLSGKTPGLPEDVPVWEGTYDTYKKRMRVLTAGNSSGMRKTKQQKALADADLSTIAGQLAFVETLIRKSDASTPDQIRLLEMLQKLQAKVASPDDRRELLDRNPNYVDVTNPSVAIDFFMAVRDEWPGGLTVIPFATLTRQELEALAAIINPAIEAKLQEERIVADELAACDPAQRQEPAYNPDATTSVQQHPDEKDDEDTPPVEDPPNPKKNWFDRDGEND